MDFPGTIVFGSVVSFDKDLLTIMSQTTVQSVGDSLGQVFIHGANTCSQDVNEIVCHKPW